MPDQDLDVVNAETPSDEATPAEELSETPSDETPPDDESDGDDDAPKGESPEGDQDGTEKPTTPEARKAWENLEKKFDYIKDPEDRKEAVARAYWEKARYDKAIRAENAELKDRVARLEAEREANKPEEKPPAPHPDVVKVEAEIQALYQKAQTIQKQQADLLTALNKADRAVAVAEDRLSDAYDDDAKKVAQSKVEAAKDRYENIKRDYLNGQEKLETAAERLQDKVALRDRIAEDRKEQAKQEREQQQSRERFDRDFPKHVDKLIFETADEMKIPKDDKIREALWKSVNRGVLVELKRLQRADVREVDVPALVGVFVKEFAEIHDLVSRKTFTERSREKLAVAGRTGPGAQGTPAAPARPVPASLRPPVPVAHMGSDTTPGMLAARLRLTKRLG